MLTALRTTWVATFVAVALLLGGAGTVLSLRHRVPARTSSTQEDFKTVAFTSEMGREFSPAISPDGRQVAYVWDKDADVPDIYLRAVQDGSPQMLDAAPATRLFPSWSPDGKQLAFLQVEGDDVYIVTHSFADGSEQKITRIGKQVGQWAGDNSPLLGAQGPTWTTDGKGLILSDYDTATSSGGIFQLDMDGRRTTLILSRGEDRELYPRLSPDGKLLAYVRYSSHGVGELFVKTMADATDSRQITFDKKTIQGIAWTQDDRHLLFSLNRDGAFQLWSIAVDGGNPAIVRTDSSSAAEPAIDKPGDWIVYVQSNVNWNIWRWPLNGSAHDAPQRLISSSGRNYDARYSPDGSQIAFVSDRSGSMELWVANSGGEDAK